MQNYSEVLSDTDCIIALCGPSKSGKTTLGKKLARALCFPFVSFGDCVRKEANRRGIKSPSPKQLQDLGSELVATDLCSFCRSVVEDGGFVVGGGLVIDGVRHVSALSALRDLIPRQPFKLVYIVASLDERVRRSSLDAQELTKLDSHPVESELHQLKSKADLVLDSSSPHQDSFSALLNWVLDQRSR